MGSSDVVDALLLLYGGHRRSCRRKDLTGSTPDRAARIIARTARELPVEAGRRLVVFENVPSSDESCVSRQARGIYKLIESGVTVLLTLSPEARQLLEALPSCHVVWLGDLIRTQLDLLKDVPGSDALRRWSRGVPSLVKPLLARAPESGGSTLPQSYWEVFSSLAALSVRPSLSDEELRLRLCMYLLGCGSSDDLRRVLGRDSFELLAGLRSMTPVFGISADLSSFDCLCSDRPYALSLILSRLSALCALFPRDVELVEQILVERGAFARCAALLRMVGVGEHPEAFLPQLAAFLDYGETELAQKIVKACRNDEVVSAKLDALGDVISAVANEETRGGLETARTDGLSDDAFMLLDARRAAQGLPFGCEGGRAFDSPLARRLVVHRKTCDLMIAGRSVEALGTLVSNGGDEEPTTVSGALLELDREMVRLLVGDRGDERAGLVNHAEELLSRSSLAGLSSYVSVVEVVRRTMRGDACAGAEAASLAARAERRGDVVPQVIGLIAGCICDLRTSTLTRANVKALLAQSVAKRTSLAYLARVAELLGEVARYQLGERIASPDAEVVHDDLFAVHAFLLEVMGTDEESLQNVETAREVPRDALWLLGILSRGMGEFSALVKECMPPVWRRAAKSSFPDVPSSPARSESVEGACGTMSEGVNSAEGSVPIEIHLLGGFSVCVRGVRVPDWKLEQRGAKSMLEYLALHRGVAKRYQLVEQVWPGCDYTTGFNHAYQATSVVRRAIGEIETGLDPFVAGRASREVALDMGIVGCDVDAFCSAAREASDSTDPSRALEMARRAERLYVGDLYLPSVDATGFIANARSELRDLYADAMVAGGDAALSLGRERTAIRLASNALAINDLREDAVIILIRALRTSGRAVEAEQQYRRYSGRLLRANGHACPSERLRRLMGETPAPPSTGGQA